ncbi:MAG: energy transducer TonB [Acidobacteriota bacterium]|nr:energy transducer TonB [Acidobacteriota bacterium]
MLRRIGMLTLNALAFAALSATALGQSNLTAKANVLQPAPSIAGVESDRVRDGLVGPVRRVRTEIAKLANQNGKTLEGKHAILEVVAYDIKGNKTENQYFPIAGANLTGKEVYKYDDKGNISEMTFMNDDGSLVSKEVYKYEFDFAGNWNRMTTSVAVIEGGRVAFEPTEITYRSIMYYLDENMMRMAQPTMEPGAKPVLASQPAANSAASGNSGTKSATVETKPPVDNSTSNHKISISLPASTITSEKLKSDGTSQVLNARPNSAQAPMVKLDSEPPPPQPARTILKPVSGGVLNGTAISLPSPVYPEAARRLRMSGVVSVEVVVDETGKVISARATNGPSALREVAVQAALHARFSPTKLSGQPVKVTGSINYKFTLSQ